MIEPLAKRNIEIMIDMTSRRKPEEKVKIKEKIQRYIDMLDVDIRDRAEYNKIAKDYMISKWKEK